MSDKEQNEAPPRVIVFAGPNGAGKSSHAAAILSALDVPVFVNADLIARGLIGRNTQLAAFAAGKVMLKQLGELAASGADFAFERLPRVNFLLQPFER